MTKKIIILLLLMVVLIRSIPINAKVSPCAEIFDPKQNKVVKVVQVNSEIYNMVTSWIKDIDNLYGKLDPITDDGYAVRIPLDPAIKVQKKSLNSVVSEVYIIIPEKEPPFFLIFEDKNKPSCFVFHGDIGRLSKALGFNLKISHPQ